MLGAGETVIGQTRKLGADLHARGLYRLVGDDRRVEKRSGEERRSEALLTPDPRSSTAA
jgi:chemotaxis protein methyltransferase CheR